MSDCVKRCGISSLTHTDREVELLKPIEDVTIYEKESASFDTEISEEDVPGQWKLKGELLRPSPVSTFLFQLLVVHDNYFLNSGLSFRFGSIMTVTSRFSNLEMEKKGDALFVDHWDI